MVRRQHDRQFKLAASRLVVDGAKTVVELAMELGISTNSLRRWVEIYRLDGEEAFPGKGHAKQNKDYEILKLKKQVEDLEMESEILKKFRAFLKQNHS